MDQRGSSRRCFIRKTLTAGAGIVMASGHGGLYRAAASPRVQQPVPSMNGKRALVVYGGWEGHYPRETAELFIQWIRTEGAEVVVSDSLDIYLDRETMSSVDLIIHNWTMGQITPEQEVGLLETIRNGAGIAGWHGGLGDSFRQNVEFQFMVGGQWVSHPGGIIDYRVNITGGDDFVTRGLRDFDIRSEQYYMHVDPNVKVLATTRFTGEHAPWIDGCIMPVVWKKYYGSGRVFYSSLGHSPDDFSLAEVIEMQKRGILWASESRYHPYEEWITPAY